MVLILSLLLAGALVGFGRRFIQKHSGLCYLFAALISCGVVALVWSGVSKGWTGWTLTLANIFLQGGLAGAFFILVMFAGAFPDRHPFRRAIMPIRGPLSILASILTLGHNLAYGRTYFVYLFAQPDSLRWNVLAAALCSIVMILIMLPLFVTSFLRVRRRMQPRRWKRLQRLAYGFYGLMYIHVLLLNITGAREGKWTALLNLALYSALFLTYASMRLGKAAEKQKKENWTPWIRLICAGLLAGILVLLLAPGATTAPEGEENAAVAYEEPEAWADGKYKGAAIGYNGRLTVSVVVKEGKLNRIVCTGNVEDEPYITNATEGVFSAMIEGNTTIVDTVSSATTTSDALIEAVREALKDAGMDNT